MYETILQLLNGIINAPLETLGIAAALFYIQRGYVLMQYILLRRYRYCRLLRKNMKIVTDNFIQIYALHKELETTGKNQFMIRVSPNIMNEELLSNFALDAAGLGLLIGAYNWSYAAMQIPLGITMDRLGPRFLLCVVQAYARLHALFLAIPQIL